jgi:tRNA pseudouridine55 synthase
MPDGVLALDKPRGVTSNAALGIAKLRLGVRKAGHAGTLDPMATGVLVIATGRLTRLLALLGGAGKVYHATVQLGVATDTLDVSGQVIASSEVPPLEDGDFARALTSLRGEYLQAPPAFSARKVRGQRAYALARRGEEVALAPRRVRIDELTLLGRDRTRLTLRVRCSSGTYVRALARDLGAALGVPAVLAALRREQVGSIGLEWAVPPEQASWERRVPLERALPELSLVRIDADLVAWARHGRALALESGLAEGVRALVLAEGEAEPYDALVGVYRVDGGALVPEMVFAREP